jgi:hypothetical protein
MTNQPFVQLVVAAAESTELMVSERFDAIVQRS